VEQIFTCSPWKTPHQSRWTHLKEACDPMGSPAAASSWKDLWTHGEPTLEQSVPEGLNPVEGTHAGAGEECKESFS